MTPTTAATPPNETPASENPASEIAPDKASADRTSASETPASENPASENPASENPAPTPASPLAPQQPSAPASEQPSTAAAGERSDPTRRWPAPVILGVALLLHLALLFYHASPQLIFSSTPVGNIDYMLHFYQVDRGQKALQGWGQLWSYDPQTLAGQPAGAVEDLSSKTVILFSTLLHSWGMPLGQAFNLYIFLVLLLVPAVGYGAARLLSLTRVQSAVACLLWVVLLYFDSFVHWVWYCGMISWTAASCLSILLLALLFATLERRRAWLWAPVALCAGLVVLFHPFAAVVAGVPCAVLFFRGIGGQWRFRLPGLLATLVCVAGAAAVWLPPALKFWHYVMDSGNFLKPTLSYLIYDALDLVKEPWDTGGGPVRSAFRFLCWGATAFCFWGWYKKGDRRLLPWATLLGLTLFLAYAGGYLWVTRQIQPYRNVVPAILAGALPAAVVLSDLLSPRTLKQLPTPAKALLVLAALLVAPRVVRTVLVFVPEPLPVAQKPIPGANPNDPPPNPLTGMYGPRPVRVGLHGTPPAFPEIKAWLQKNHQGPGRVLVQDWMLGEYLVWASDLPILGGLDERNVHHVDAHLFRWHPQGKLPGDKLRTYLERYAVAYVVISKIKPALEWRKDLLEFQELVAGSRIYKTRIQPSYFARGRGRVTHQSLNSIRVQGAQGPEVVLRFHWMETLRCRPQCQVERSPVTGDRVGFIRVPNPPPAFELFNSYRFP